MKRLFISYLIVALSLTGFAQDTDEVQTLLGADVSVSGFGGPFSGFTSIDGQFAYMSGGGGAAIFNQSFFFGGYGFGTSGNIESQKQGFEFYNISVNHGGFWMGYNWKPRKVFHPVFHLQTGWGEVEIGKEGRDTNYESSQIFVLNPTLELEMNVTRFFKVGLGANYQVVLGGNSLTAYTAMDFSRPGAFVSFKFGWFAH